MSVSIEELQLLRGQAIQEYANLEQSPWFLFAHMAGMHLDVAGIIFYKITSSGARDSIMEKLIKKKYPGMYCDFWISIAKKTRTLSEMRNHIVHWNVVQAIQNDGTGTAKPPEYILEIPGIPFMNPQPGQFVTSAEIVRFMEECHVTYLLCNQFRNYLERPETFGTVLQTWHDIFQQPVTYPLPCNHPLFPTTQVHQNQPGPSQASQ